MQRVQIQGTGGQHSGWFIMLDIWEVRVGVFPTGNCVHCGGSELAAEREA